MQRKEPLTKVEKEVLEELSSRLGIIKFVVGSEGKKRVVLSNKRVKVKIVDPELKQRILDKKPVSYQAKYIKCSKEGCSKCPHGPYIYAFWRSEKTGKVRSVYLGKYKCKV